MVVSFAGDGCFLMNGQEFATAVQHGANVVIAVIDNGMYGTIRMHQEREYPTRVYGTELKNPDFAAYARAFGGHGETVEKTEDFAAAFERALAAGKPAIIHVKTDPEALTSRITLSKLREQALAKRALGLRWARRMRLAPARLRLYRDARGDLSRPACDHVKNR